MNDIIQEDFNDNEDKIYPILCIICRYWHDEGRHYGNSPFLP